MPTQPSTDTIRVQLNYPAAVVDRPIIYQLVKRFSLVPDIRRGSIDSQTGGFLFLELTGERERLKRAIEWLEEMGVGVDAIGVDGALEWAI